MVKNLSIKRKKPCNLNGKKKSKSKRKLKKSAMGGPSMNKNEKEIVNPKGMALWMKTYENCINWHQFYQKHYWKNVALNLKTKNKQLEKKLREYEQVIKIQNTQIDSTKIKNDELEYETSSGSESEDDTISIGNKIEPIDEEYLKFLEITYKHREEMEKAKNSQNENTNVSNLI